MTYSFLTFKNDTHSNPVIIKPDLIIIIKSDQVNLMPYGPIDNELRRGVILKRDYLFW